MSKIYVAPSTSTKVAQLRQAALCHWHKGLPSIPHWANGPCSPSHSELSSETQ